MTTTPSITLRLAALFALGTLLLLTGIGYFLNHSVDAHLAEMDWDELFGKWELAGNLVSQVHGPADIAALPKELEEALVGHPNLFLSMADPSGHILYTTPGFVFSPQVRVARETVPSFAFMATWREGERMFRGIAAEIPSGLPGHPAFVLRAALETEQHRHFLEHFHRFLAIALLVGATAAAGLGWIIARRGLLPLRDMASVARRISASHLGERLEAGRAPRELQDLAVAFNDMLSRLETSFRRLNDYSSDIAHELRTPINNLMIQSQVALSQARDAEAYRDIIASNLEEFDRMARMIADMLLLAKADNGLMAIRRERVDLRTEIENLLEFFGAFAEEREVTFAATGQAHVVGDRVMLQRAIANLLANAIDHTPAGGRIHIRMDENRQHSVRVEIENPGPSIPGEQLERIFDRFYRLDPSRGARPDGVGLGLAITRSIVAIHGGEITATSTEKATIFSFTLPKDTPP